MTIRLGAIGLLFAFAPGVFAQTAPVPGNSTGEPTGFLSRSAFSVSQSTHVVVDLIVW
jgi:hypothetical protein